MKEAAEAIKTVFTGAPTGGFYIGIGGRLYYRKAPQKPTFPYAVFFMVDGIPEYYFDSSPEIARLFYQFAIFSKGASGSEVETLSGYLKSLYDSAILSVSGWNFVSWKRSMDIEMPVEEVDGISVYQNVHQYDLTINK